MAVLYYEVAVVGVVYSASLPSDQQTLHITDPITGATFYDPQGTEKYLEYETVVSGTSALTTYLKLAYINASYTSPGALGPRAKYTFTDGYGSHTLDNDIWAAATVPDGFTLPSFGPVVTVHNITLTKGQTLIAASSLSPPATPSALPSHNTYSTISVR